MVSEGEQGGERERDEEKRMRKARGRLTWTTVARWSARGGLAPLEHAQVRSILRGAKVTPPLTFSNWGSIRAAPERTHSYEVLLEGAMNVNPSTVPLPLFSCIST